MLDLSYRGRKIPGSLNYKRVLGRNERHRVFQTRRNVRYRLIGHAYESYDEDMSHILVIRNRYSRTISISGESQMLHELHAHHWSRYRDLNEL